MEDENGLIVMEEVDLIETNYYNGNNEVIKISNQKCVILYEKNSVYAFRHCGHQFFLSKVI